MKTLRGRWALCALMAVVGGCAAPPAKLRFQLDELYQNNFKTLQTPSAEDIKASAVRKELPYATFGAAWDSAIVVLAQHGAIVRSQPSEGIIVVATTPPVAALVERGEIVVVYLKDLQELYKRIDTASQVASPQAPTMDRKTADGVLDEIAIQVYSRGKWKYLLQESSSRTDP